MQVKRFLAAGRDRVNVRADKDRLIAAEKGAGFLQHFPLGNASSREVGSLAVSPRQKPPVQPFVMDQQHACAIWTDNNSGAGDVARVVDVPGKRVGRPGEQRESEITTFFGFSVVLGVEPLQKANHIRGKQHCPDYSRAY